MKKILLTIAITLLIFQMVVLATTIEIGMPAINRGATTLSAYTYINTEAVANATGTITTVKIWSWGNLTNVEVATFYRPDPGGFPNNFTTRDTELIGAVEDDAERTFDVDLDVVAGDYIGMYFSGFMERDTSGFAGVWSKSGDNVPCTNVEFTFEAGDAVSLNGSGATVEVGWPHKWNTQSISKWNTKEFTKWNDLE